MASLSDSTVEHTFCCFSLDISPTGCYAAISYGSHPPLVSTNPDVVDFLTRMRDTVVLNNYVSTDSIPTEGEIAYEILTGRRCPDPERLLPGHLQRIP